MSNYAISFAASAYSRLGDEGAPITDIKNATALGVTMRIRGDRLKNAATDAAIAQLAAGYLGLQSAVGGGGTNRVKVGAAGVGTNVCFAEFASASIVDTDFYTIRAWRDASATHDFGIELFNAAGTLVDDGTDDTDATFTNGTYGDFSINFDGAVGASAEALVCDWCACWDRIPPGVGVVPDEPTGVETGLLHWHKWDENGGTVGDDQQSATDAVLTGSYSWILLDGATTSPPMFRGS